MKMYKLSKYTVTQSVDSGVLLHSLKNGGSVFLNSKSVCVNDGILEANNISKKDLETLQREGFIVDTNANETCVDEKTLEAILRVLNSKTYLDISLNLDDGEHAAMFETQKQSFKYGLIEFIEKNNIKNFNMTVIAHGSVFESFGLNGFSEEIAELLQIENINVFAIDYILRHYSGLSKLNSTFSKTIKLVYTYEEFTSLKENIFGLLGEKTAIEVWVQCTCLQSADLVHVQNEFTNTNVKMYFDLVDETNNRIIGDESLIKYFNMFQSETFYGRDLLALQPFGMVCKCSLANSIIVDGDLNIRKCFCRFDEEANIIGKMSRQGIVFNENAKHFLYSYTNMYKHRKCLECELIFCCCMAGCIWQYAVGELSCPKQKYFVGDFLKLMAANIDTYKK